MMSSGSRTLEPGLSLLMAAEIRVVVLPIGPMPRDTFDAYLSAFNAHRHVPLHAARCFRQGGPKSPFPHLAYKSGAMHFRFMQADEARRRTRIADLHLHRQVVAVLGLLHCPLLEDLGAAHAEFGRSARQWPEALLSRCCAFEPSAAHLATSGCQKLPDLMLLPAEHLDAHLEVYMTEFAADVLAAIEDAVLNASVASVKLNTYADSGEFLGSSLAQMEEGLRKLNMNEEELKEKKRWGRLQKAKGDWALLAGSPRDAFEHYKSGMELSKAAGDAVWYGAAVEGLAHARVLEALIAARPAAAVRPSLAAAAAARKEAAAAAAAAAEDETPPAAGSGPAPGAGETAAAARAALLAQTSAQTSAGKEQLAVAAGTAAAAAAEPVAPGAAGAGHAAEAAAGAAAAAAAAADHQPLYTITSCESMDLPVPVAAAAGSAAGTAKVGRASGEVPAAAAAADAETAGGAAATRSAGVPCSQTLVALGKAAPGATDGLAAAPAAVSGSTSNKAAAAAAPSAAAAQHAPSRLLSLSGPLSGLGSGSGSGWSASGYSLSGPAAWGVLAAADLEGEVRELLAEARAWYRKKGGALVLQIEQQLKLCRFVAGLHGPVAGRIEASEAVGLIIESLGSLSLQEDRLVALVEAGQLLGLVGCGRKRLLLLWTALEMYRAGGDKGPSEAGGMLQLTLKSLEPPEVPRQQDPDDLPHVHWAMKRFIAWQQQHIDMVQQQTASRQVSSSSSRPAKHSGSNNSRRGQTSQSSSSGSRGMAAAAAAQQQQQPQQQFLQLLGPRLQLLSPEQAGLLQQFCSSNSSSSSSREPGFSNAKLWGLPPGRSGLGLINEWVSPWGSVLVAVLEAVVSIARTANAPVEAWEAAATLLRESYPLLPQSLQVSLMEGCASAGAAMGSRARQRPGPGPGPQAQLKRVLPGPPCLQPLHLSASDMAQPGSAAGGGSSRRGEGSPSASGPFIFNPYAAKRKGASAAAAAEAALPEWVCGEEGWVEVLLVNPCATPLKLDQLQLVVHPMHQQQQQQSGDGTSAGGSSSGGGSAAAAAAAPAASSGGGGGSGGGSGSSLVPVQQQQRSVSVSLAAGSKPVRVLLSYTAARPGLMAVTGIQASCWGVSWHQPFVQLPRLAAAAGHEALYPQGAFTVAVQPPLPLIKAVLHGPEVQVAAPAEEELAGLSSSSSSSSSSASSAAAAGSWAAAAGAAGSAAAAAAASVSELGKKVVNVLVFEGQTLSWTLNLTNISAQAVTGCKITVLNAKGGVVKPLSPAPAAVAAASGQQQQQQLPSSFSGAHMEVSKQGLAADLPLNPGASLALPVAVTVGKPPGDAFDAVMLQVCITYHSTATTACGSSSSGEPQLIGRRLTLPIRLSIQPTLQIKNVRFLQQTLPLLNGQRHIKLPGRLLQQHQQQLASSLAGRPDSRTGSGSGLEQGLKQGQFQQQQQQQQGSAGGGSPGLGGSMLQRHPSHHMRNSSDGAVQALAGLSAAGVSAMLLAGGSSSSRSPSSSPTRRGLAAKQQQQQGLPSPAASGFAAAVAGDAAAAAGGSSSSGTDLGSSSGLQQHQGPAAGGSPTKRDSRAGPKGGAPAAVGGSPSGWLAVGSEPVLELAVRNASERYFRAWLGCLPDRLSAENALSVVGVLEPGDTQRLVAVLPAATTATATAASGPPGSSTKAKLGPGHGPAAAANSAGAGGVAPAAAAAAADGSGLGLAEPSRLVCAEGLVQRLVVCWEMITGAAAAGQLPRGKVQLAPVDVAANLTPGAVAALHPSSLLLRFSAPPAVATAGSSCPAELADLASLASSPSGHLPSGLASLISPGLVLPGLSGPLWGLHMSVGEWLSLDLEITYSSSSSSTEEEEQVRDGCKAPQEEPLQLLVTLHVTDLLSSSSSSSGLTAAGGFQQPGTPASATSAAAAAAAGGFAGHSPLTRGSSMASAFAQFVSGPAGTGSSGGSVQGAPAAAAAASGSISGSSQQGLVDPGVFLVGCYSGLHVRVSNGSRETVRLQALLVQPGLYQFGVADVVRVGSGSTGRGSASSSAAATDGLAVGVADVAGSRAAGGAGGKGSSSTSGTSSHSHSRVYFNQDRMYVLVSS